VLVLGGAISTSPPFRKHKPRLPSTARAWPPIGFRTMAMVSAFRRAVLRRGDAEPADLAVA
jgi:hypothetical protein